MCCTLAGYIHDAIWLQYLHKSGCASQYNMVRLVHPQHLLPSKNIMLYSVCDCMH